MNREATNKLQLTILKSKGILDKLKWSIVALAVNIKTTKTIPYHSSQDPWEIKPYS
jgi:hypothetical protein